MNEKKPKLTDVGGGGIFVETKFGDSFSLVHTPINYRNHVSRSSLGPRLFLWQRYEEYLFKR